MFWDNFPNFEKLLLCVVAHLIFILKRTTTNQIKSFYFYWSGSTFLVKCFSNMHWKIEQYLRVTYSFSGIERVPRVSLSFNLHILCGVFGDITMRCSIYGKHNMTNYRRRLGGESVLRHTFAYEFRRGVHEKLVYKTWWPKELLLFAAMYSVKYFVCYQL